ncbi:Na+-transporting oxaloacetate decarboxylase beta subunit [anaerobic digester metagenome]|jgi:Na+-transporting methylmalonyl-CoA/oxaloacetate decarboxylase beta subunit
MFNVYVCGKKIDMFIIFMENSSCGLYNDSNKLIRDFKGVQMNNKMIKKLVMIFTVFCTAAAALGISYQYLLPLYLSYKLNKDLSDASAIGIIGGADGPTTIYLSGSVSPGLTAVFAVFAAIGIAYLIITKRKHS